MPSQPSYLPNVVAHLASLGLGGGDPIPSNREIAEAIGVHRDSVKRLLRELRLAGVLHEGAAPGAPSILHRPEILAALATEQGMAQYRDGKRAAATSESSPTHTAGVANVGGGTEAWQLVLGRFDRIAASLEGGEELTRELIAEVRALPERIASAVAAVIPAAPVRVPSRTRTPKVQTRPGTYQNPSITALTKRLGYSKAGVALGISDDSARRYALGERAAPAEVEAAAQSILGQRKNG